MSIDEFKKKWPRGVLKDGISASEYSELRVCKLVIPDDKTKNNK
jgi:hypothetical protein